MHWNNQYFYKKNIEIKQNNCAEKLYYSSMSFPQQMSSHIKYIVIDYYAA